MRRRLIKIGAGAALLAVLAGGGAAWATAGDDSDDAVTGTAAQAAARAALAHVGGGRAVEVERSEEGAAFEVEVARADGSVLEVQLDEGYRVVGVETDSEGPADGPDEDEADDEETGE